MAYKGKKIAVVMPAYKAEKTLMQCYDELPKELVDDIILVDDRSPDGTVELAKMLPIHVHVHEKNTGYGGNQKTCYRLARERGNDIAVMLHPDNQYDPSKAPEMIRAMVDGGHKAVYGSRMIRRADARAGGMPKYKYVANIALTNIANMALGTDLAEMHSGYRAYDLSIFDDIDISKNSDDFIFDTQIIIQLAKRGIHIHEIPIPTRYFDDASQISFWRSTKYGLGILKHLFLHKTGLRDY